MVSVLVRKEMPYLFLLLLAVLGFLVVKMYDRASTLKILECSARRQADIGKYVFKNLSKNSKVEQAKLFFVDTNSTIRDVSIRYIPPAVEPDAPKTPKQVSPTRWYVNIGDLGPSDSVEVTIVYENYRNPPIIRFASGNEVLFLYRNFLTLFYGNEFYVLLGLVVLALALSIFYTVVLSRQQGGV